MRIGRVVYLLTAGLITVGSATELTDEGLKMQPSANADDQLFAPKGEAHKVRYNFAKQVKELIGVERPAVREGDAVLVVLDGRIVAGQMFENLKGETGKVLLTKGSEPVEFPSAAIQPIDGNTEAFVRDITGVGLAGYSNSNPVITLGEEEDNDGHDEGDEGDDPEY